MGHQQDWIWWGILSILCRRFAMSKICGKHNVKYVEQSGIIRCPECRRETNKKYLQKHAKEIKAWRTSEAGKACRLKYDRSAKRKASKDRNRPAMRAREAVRRAVKRGTLIPAETCSICKHLVKTEAHHHLGYEKPHQLDVVWVCHPCHMSIE